jgi:hypothetical protein
MRPLPRPSNRPLGKGPGYFVDPVRGADRQDGTLAMPWKTLARAVERLKPGDTLYLRGGTYYEVVTLSRSGRADKPITVRSYPGEMAVLDSGLREFFEAPAHAWEPFSEGAPGEFRSTKSYSMGGGYGNFGDSMVPLHHYINFADLRSANELAHAGLGKRADDPVGMYCGPGVRRDPKTGRIHIRLAHTKLDGLGANHYRGDTDPRKVPLVIAGHDYALRIAGARHVRVQDVVVRGARRAALHVRGAEDVELDGLTLYGSLMAARIGNSRGVRLIHSALRGHAAPWHSRFHHKYRSAAGYLVVTEGVNSDFEIAHCELTDHHDGLLIHAVEGMRLHHNLVDNFNDDGIEPGPKKERGKTYIYQNLISRCLSPFTAHGKKPAPVQGEEGSGVYLYRNIIDLRRGTYYSPPEKPDPTGAYLNRATTILAHDHGSPILQPYHVYHNTFLLPGSAWRGYYAFTWGSHLRGTTRRVFNNLFVQVAGQPGLNFLAVSADDDFQADGNLFWGVKEGPKVRGDFFGTFRKSALFAASKKRYPPGLGANDRFADPKLVSLGGEGKQPSDLRLLKDSPAIGAGVEIPAAWPDPLRKRDGGRPDIGALPFGAEPFRVGPIAPEKR